jgi:hypothetical protein
VRLVGYNPDRLRSEASVAALCGVSPLEILGQEQTVIG